MIRGGKREGAGRPPLYGENMRRVTAWLTQEQIEWLEAAGNLSNRLRDVVEAMMHKYTVQIGTDPMRGKWQENAMFDYKGAAAYAAKVVNEHPEQLVTVWDMNFQAVVSNRSGVTQVDWGTPNAEHAYIAAALRNAQGRD